MRRGFYASYTILISCNSPPLRGRFLEHPIHLWTTLIPQICPSLLHNVRSTLPSSILKDIFWPPSLTPWWHFYFQRWNSKVVFAVVFLPHTITAGLPIYASAFSVELTAILEAIHTIRSMASGDYVIFTNSRSALETHQATGSPYSKINTISN